MTVPTIALFMGGVSAEREVSLGSGQAAARALERFFKVESFDIRHNDRLPAGLQAENHVVFSTLHGQFGEDGTMQALLDQAGVEYAGCDAASSALTFDKGKTKVRLRQEEIPVADDLLFNGDNVPSVSEILQQLGSAVVFKPIDQGSSVGLAFAKGEDEIAAVIKSGFAGNWIAETQVIGREGTIGILNGEAMEIVEIKPLQGRFDYESKYTKGKTEYLAPADFSQPLTDRIKKLATRAYQACGCRDFARIDFIVGEDQVPYFLEINTLPGLKETSLLPMSAAAFGYDFDDLLQKLVEPAMDRHNLRYSNH